MTTVIEGASALEIVLGYLQKNSIKLHFYQTQHGKVIETTTGEESFK